MRAVMRLVATASAPGATVASASHGCTAPVTSAAATREATGVFPDAIQTGADVLSPRQFETTEVQMPWRTARVVSVKDETTTAKTFRFGLDEPVPHLAGQHYVVRLTAPDGYTASWPYPIASASTGSSEFELTVERLESGEVSTFLCDVVEPGTSSRFLARAEAGSSGMVRRRPCSSAKARAWCRSWPCFASRA
jgi:hypothetical protein